MSKETAIATLTIEKPGTMTPHGRKLIAGWLQRSASDLISQGEQYNDSGPFTSRYLVAVNS